MTSNQVIKFGHFEEPGSVCLCVRIGLGPARSNNFWKETNPKSTISAVMCSTLLCRCQVTSGPVVPNLRFGTTTDP